MVLKHRFYCIWICAQIPLPPPEIGPGLNNCDHCQVKCEICFIPKILSMELFDGRVQLKMLNCLLSLSGMSLRPPPGCIMAAINWQSTIVVKSPGFSRLYIPCISIIWRVISFVTYHTNKNTTLSYLCIKRLIVPSLKYSLKFVIHIFQHIYKFQSISNILQLVFITEFKLETNICSSITIY